MSNGANTRAPWAAAAARFSVAAVDGRCSSRTIGSAAGSSGSPVHWSSCTLRNAIPAYWLNPRTVESTGTCIVSIQVSSQRASSRMSGTLSPVSGTRRVPSPRAFRSASRAVWLRSYSPMSCATAIPPLTTYLPWSPASYQPPVTSVRKSGSHVQLSMNATGCWHPTEVSPWLGATPMCPAALPYPGTIESRIGVPLRWV